MPGSFLPLLGAVGGFLMSALMRPSAPSAPKPAPAPPPPTPAPIPDAPKAPDPNAGNIPAADVAANEQARNMQVKRNAATALNTSSLLDLNSSNNTTPTSSIQLKTLLGG